MKQLISLDGNDNRCWFVRGNDGDMHIVMATSDEFTADKYKGIMHSVRIGVGNSGGQHVPNYVKNAISNLIDAYDKWNQTDADEYDF